MNPSTSATSSVDSNQNSSSLPQSSYGTYDKAEENNIESIKLDCFTNLKDERFTGAPGKIFRVKCPSCGLVDRPIYGSFIYHPLSSICKAANHGGVLNKESSGYVLVEILGGKKIYNGSIGSQNIISATFGSSEVSFRIKAGLPPTKIDCAEAANSETFISGAIGTKYVIICPENCAKTNGQIFGSEFYADMSPICVAGIHSGNINDHGGELEIVIEGSQNFYKGTKSNGIISQPREAYNRSFRFVGNKNALFHRYTEDFKGSLINKYEINPEENSFDNKLDYWSFKEIELQTEKKKIKAISHTGTIKSKMSDSYGSIISLKKAKFRDGRIRVNFLIKDLNTFAILFRYNDKNSYYAIQFDPKSDKNNLKFISKVEGNFNILETKSFEISVEKWYRLVIVMNNDKFLVNMQNDISRESKILFKIKNEELASGSIGFAVNGNSDLVLAGIKIDEGNNNNHTSGKNNLTNKNRRSFRYLMKLLGPKERGSFCKKLWGKYNPQEVATCMIPFNYCKLKCDDEVSEIENLINFKCIRECSRTLSFQKNNIKVQAKEWIPKVNEKIDFKPKNENLYVPAQILSKKTKAKAAKQETMINVQFVKADGNTYTESVKFPSPSIKPCGIMLEKRKDCLKE